MKGLNTELKIRPVARIVFGVLLAIVGSPFLIIGAIAAYAFLAGELPGIAIYLISLLIGLFCLNTGIRMALGAKRSDGGLLSPTVLRIGGLIFLCAPIVPILLSDELKWYDLWHLLELGFWLSCAAACFALASRRQSPTLGPTSIEDDT